MFFSIFTVVQPSLWSVLEHFHPPKRKLLSIAFVVFPHFPVCCYTVFWGQEQTHTQVSEMHPVQKSPQYFLIKKNFFLSNLYVQHGARTHHPEIKSRMPYWPSQPAPQQVSNFIFSLQEFRVGKLYLHTSTQTSGHTSHNICSDTLPLSHI